MVNALNPAGAVLLVLSGSGSGVVARDEVPDASLGQGTAPPNVVMTIVDDAGWDDVGYHNDLFHTPTIDMLAKEGVKLEGMYTDRQCTPARSQLMTGRYNIHTGMQDNMIYALEPRGLGLQYETLPQKLSYVGYDTIGVGKWHLGHYQESLCPWKRGFDQYFGNLLSGGNQETYTQKSESWFTRVNGAFNHYETNYEGYYLVEGGPDGFNAIGSKYDGIHSTELYTTKAIDYVNNYTTSNRWGLPPRVSRAHYAALVYHTLSCLPCFENKTLWEIPSAVVLLVTHSARMPIPQNAGHFSF